MAVLQRMSSSSDAAPFLIAMQMAGVEQAARGAHEGNRGWRKPSSQDRSDIEIFDRWLAMSTRNGGHPSLSPSLMNGFEDRARRAELAIDAVAVRIAEFTR